MKKLFFPALILFFVSIFFWQIPLKGLLPIPSDTIVGLYYPFRDIHAETNPNGVPFKNFLITDPVRQQYPWKVLTISLEKKLQLPLWNPYNFTGTPLQANFQSASFYPLNLIFFLVPFYIGWTILVVIQPLFAALFLYFYLNNFKLKKISSLVGAISFGFGGFSIAWLEWGTILSTALWLPLILLSIDKLFFYISKNKFFNKWFLIFILSMSSSLLGGHLQTFFYVLILSLIYIIARFFQIGKNIKTLGLFLLMYIIVAAITFVQWYSTFQFILLSARNIDVIDFRMPGWFVPWQNIIQFIIPDFFGNPTTLNYWGAWNYGEFIGYIGVSPLILALLALFFRRDKKTFLFGSVFFMSMMFAFPSFISEIPFRLKLPFISTAQPTRLMFVIGFSLSVLSAFGFDYLIRTSKKKMIGFILAPLVFIFSFVWIFVLLHNGEVVTLENLLISRQNIILPTILLIILSFLFIIYSLDFKKNKLIKRVKGYILILIVLVIVFDLLRFGWKFTPFTNLEYLYPSTPVIEFLQKQKGLFRVMSLDDRIFPPNFSIMYKIQTVDGYDPLYLRRYGELIAASERGRPDINPPFGFNRSITPQNYSSKIMDLMNVRYILSMNKLHDEKMEEVLRSGSIIVYENQNVLPRAFFVKKTISTNSRQDAISLLFNPKVSFEDTAVVEDVMDNMKLNNNWQKGDIRIINYTEGEVMIETENSREGFLVLADSFYPTWNATIDGKKTKIYLTNFNFRGIIVPEGKHTIEFYNTLF